MKVFNLAYNAKVKIGEHFYDCPAPPKKKEDILFYNESPENAYWKRKTNYPDIWNFFSPYKTKVDKEATVYNEDKTELLTLSKSDTKIIKEIYEQEINNRLNGVFFRNGNELEYLTGANWFTLQHCKMFGNTSNGGYGRFFKFQRDVFYLMEIMWHPDILGLYISKAKKTGITQIIDGGYCVDMATRKEEWLIGFMSRTQGVGIDNNMKLFLYAFDSLPLALKPRVGFRGDKSGSIDFTERGKLNSSKASASDVLNTKVFCVPTAEHSFDSHFMNIIRFDEFPKYWQDSKQEPKEVFIKNKAGAKDQEVFRGRIIISSYPPEVDDIGSKQGEKIYLESKLSTMKNGKTISELICYHIPAFRSLKSCINEYGDCDEKLASSKIAQERDRVKGDKKALLAIIRQNPNDELEAFGSSGESSVFDKAYLTMCKFDLIKAIGEAVVPFWVEGNLIWEIGLWEAGKKDKRPNGVFCPVRFVPLTEEEILQGKSGTVRVYHKLPLEQRNMPVKLGKDDLGNVICPVKFNNFSGCDPINYADSQDVEEGSKQSIYCMNLHDERLNTMHREIVTKVFSMEYFARPELAESGYQDLVKWIIYTGSLMLLEGNTPVFFTRLMNEGLGNYMIVRHEEGYLTKWDMTLKKGDYKSVKRTADNGKDTLMEQLIESIKNFIYRSEDDESQQYAKTIKSVTLLEQYMDFKPKDTKKFDKVMGSGYTLICYDTYLAIQDRLPDHSYAEAAIRALFAATER